MQIPVGTQTSAWAKDVVGFRCKACGHRQRAEVLGIGRGMQTLLNSRGTARRRAAQNARHEIKRTIRFATCPKCDQRSGYLRFLAPYLAIAAFFIALGIVFGYAPTWFALKMREHDKELAAKWIPLVFAIPVLAFTPLGIWWRWALNDKRVRWLGDE